MLHIAQKAVPTCMSVQKMEELKEEEETVPQMFSTSSHLILWGVVPLFIFPLVAHMRNLGRFYQPVA